MLKAPEIVRRYLNLEATGLAITVDRGIKASVGGYKTFQITQVQFRFVKVKVEDNAGETHEVRINYRTKDEFETAMRYKRCELNMNWGHEAIGHLNKIIRNQNRVAKDFQPMDLSYRKIKFMLENDR